MAYVITDQCVKDFLCVDACSTDAIHPRKDEAGADLATQLFVNPDDCIDCGNCFSVCLNDAIYAEADLPADKGHFAATNAAHFK